jgi:adenylate cyclase
VIGDNVNVASRLEGQSKTYDVGTVVGESTTARAPDFAFLELDLLKVKGKSRLVVLREVLAIPSLGKTVPRHEQRRSARVQVKIPFNYRMVVNQVVIPEPREGRILDIGYHGILAEVPLAHPAFSELMIDFDLPLVGERMSDLYGKVVKVVPHADRPRIGVEFTSMTPAQKAAIQLFVQLLVQASEARD